MWFFIEQPTLFIFYKQGRIWRAFRAFPGRPWHRTQDSVGHKTDDKREKKKKKKNGKREKCAKKKKMEEREREKWTEINGKRCRNALRHEQRQKYLFDR